MASWPYNTTAWRKLRRAKLAADPLCQYCQPGTVTLATEVDHWTAIKDGGAAFEWENLVSACHRCHSRKTAIMDGGMGRARRGRVPVKGVDPTTGLPVDPGHWWGGDSLARPSSLPRSAVPLRIVCGPSGAGKSHYVAEHAAPGDAVIDLDAIRAKLSGQPWYQAPRRWLAPALEQRNTLLRELSRRRAGSAWFIVAAPRAMERRSWAAMLGAERVVVLATPWEACLAQLRGDQRRARSWPYFAMVARAWWDDYEPRLGDHLLDLVREALPERPQHLVIKSLGA